MPFDMFLKIDGIEGDPQHKGEIEVLSFSWGVTQAVSAPGGGGGAGKPTISDFSIVKAFDAASPQMMKACCTGQHFQSATLRVANRRRGSGGQDYLKVTMSDCLITSYQTGGASGTVPGESLTLNFQEIELQSADGKATTCHVPGKEL